MDRNLPGIAILMIMDTNDYISKEKCGTKYQKSVHPQTSPVDRDGVQPNHCQTYTSIYTTHKTF